MITICTGFPPEWPDDYRREFTEAFKAYWPRTIRLAAPALAEGGDLDRFRAIVPAALAADMPDDEILAWLDPDVRGLSSVPSYVIPQLLAGADLCFIGTDSGEADLAFWAVRLSPAVRSFLTRVAMEGAIDHASWQAKIEEAGLLVRDLTPGGAASWAQGPLGRYTYRAPRP